MLKNRERDGFGSDKKTFFESRIDDGFVGCCLNLFCKSITRNGKKATAGVFLKWKFLEREREREEKGRKLCLCGKYMLSVRLVGYGKSFLATNPKASSTTIRVYDVKERPENLQSSVFSQSALL